MSAAGDLLDMLRRHYLPDGRPPGGIFAPEIESPDGGRRADLIWLGVTAGNGRRLIGHEIKVTRADVLVELNDPTKSDPWQRYCHEWWLVVADPTLVAGLELPPTWGVMAPPSGRRTRSMTVVHRAPKLKPVAQAPAMQRLATWLHWRHHEREQQLTSTRRELERVRERNHDLEQRLPSEGLSQSREREVVTQIVRALGGVHIDGVGGWRVELSVDDVVAALKDLGEIQARAKRAEFEVRQRRGALQRLAREVDALLKSEAAL